MKHIRKLLSVLLALALAFSVLSAAAFSSGEAPQEPGDNTPGGEAPQELDESNSASDGEAADDPEGNNNSSTGGEASREAGGETSPLPADTLYTTPSFFSEEPNAALNEAVNAAGYNSTEGKASLTSEEAQTGVNVAISLSGDFDRNGIPERYSVFVQRDGGEVEEYTKEQIEIVSLKPETMQVYLLLRSINIGTDNQFKVAYDRPGEISSPGEQGGNNNNPSGEQGGNNTNPSGEQSEIPADALRTVFYVTVDPLLLAANEAGYTHTDMSLALVSDTVRSGATVVVYLSGDFNRNGTPEHFSVFVQRDGGAVEEITKDRIETLSSPNQSCLLIRDLDIGMYNRFLTAYDLPAGSGQGEQYNQPGGELQFPADTLRTEQENSVDPMYIAARAVGFNGTEAKKALLSDTAQSGATVAVMLNGDFQRYGTPERYSIFMQRDGGAVEEITQDRIEFIGSPYQSCLLIRDLDIGTENMFVVAYSEQGGNNNNPSGEALPIPGDALYAVFDMGMRPNDELAAAATAAGYTDNMLDGQSRALTLKFTLSSARSGVTVAIQPNGDFTAYGIPEQYSVFIQRDGGAIEEIKQDQIEVITDSDVVERNTRCYLILRDIDLGTDNEFALAFSYPRENSGGPSGEASGDPGWESAGDLDRDGKVTPADAAQVFRYIGTGVAEADIDHSQRIDAYDAALLLLYVTGRIERLPGV